MDGRLASMEAAPESAVAVERRPAGEMLRRRQGDGKWEGAGLPPIQFLDLLNPADRSRRQLPSGVRHGRECVQSSRRVPRSQ